MFNYDVLPPQAGHTRFDETLTSVLDEAESNAVLLTGSDRGHDEAYVTGRFAAADLLKNGAAFEETSRIIDSLEADIPKRVAAGFMRGFNRELVTLSRNSVQGSQV